MNERIKELRKTLNLNQTEFGNRIGVKQSSVAGYETGVRVPLDSIIVSICREFNVNKTWLETGKGEMFVPPDTFSLDDFARARGATDLEIEIIRAYFDLDPNLRKAVVSSFKNKLTSAIAANPALLVPDTPEELEAMCPPVEMSSEDAG